MWATLFEATAVVLVEDAVAFEAMPNAKWSGMMGALAQGEIDQAISHIHSRKRDAMRHDWTVLKDYLGKLIDTFVVPLHLHSRLKFVYPFLVLDQVPAHLFLRLRIAFHEFSAKTCPPGFILRIGKKFRTGHSGQREGPYSQATGS